MAGSEPTPHGEMRRLDPTAMPDDPTLLSTDSQLKRYDSLADMIGDTANPTPMVALKRVMPGTSAASLYLKLEWMNPFGSVKDRAAKWMLEDLARQGSLDDCAIVEATSGNTGIALAAMCVLDVAPHDRRRSPLHAVGEGSAAEGARRRSASHAQGGTDRPAPDGRRDGRWPRRW